MNGLCERERESTNMHIVCTAINKDPQLEELKHNNYTTLNSLLTDATLPSLIWMEKYRCKVPLPYMVNGFTYKNVIFSAFYMTNLRLWHTCTDKRKQKGG